MYVQKTFDFDHSRHDPRPDLAGDRATPPPKLVRPDRQIIYDQITWPPPDTLHDRNTITVDRVVDSDRYGPAHRFVIKRGDTVTVSFRLGKRYTGTVTGISHADQEVRISTSEGYQGIWHKLGCIYPAPASETEPTATPSRPFTFAEFRELCKKRDDGTLSYDEYTAAFERLTHSRETLTVELVRMNTARGLKAVATRMGDIFAKGATKTSNAESVYQRMLGSFVLDGVVSYAAGESYVDAVIKKVRGTSEDDWNAHQRQQAERRAELQRALADPQTLLDFAKFIQHKGQDALTAEQMARWDALCADLARERRAENGPPSGVAQFESEELLESEFSIKEGYHQRRQCPLWIVQLASRVETSAFGELKRKAKMLGGWYSSYVRDDSGFQFLSKDSAERFTQLLTANVDRSDELAARREHKHQTAADRLTELADAMLTRARETIERSSAALQNTPKRADDQTRVRGAAYADEALARTIRSITHALSTGQAKYLDCIRHGTHVRELDRALARARSTRLGAIQTAQDENDYGFGLSVSDLQNSPYSDEDVRFAAYRFPSIYRRHVESLVASCGNTRGMKQAAAKMAKTLRRYEGEYITFRREHEIEQLADFAQRAKNHGHDTEWLDRSLASYGRLQRASITDIHELRAALREYLPYRASARSDDPVALAERELVGKPLPGFFPSPRAVIDEMLTLAEIEPHHWVLEPSCGKGDVVEAITELHPDVRIAAIEQNLTLAGVLAAKGIEAEYGDFLEHSGAYDRIMMNPPFAQGADIEHVRHAYGCLAPGGRLVTVMSEGPFFRADEKSAAFREWLDRLGGECHELPPGAFATADAFRKTGVSTRLVVIEAD